MKSDDPKFTAYALGELPPEECEAIDAEVQGNDALARELNEFRQFSESLRGQLHQEAGAPLTAEQRAVILGCAPRREVILTPSVPWWRSPAFASAAAACVAVAAGTWMIGRSHSPYRNMVTTLPDERRPVTLWSEHEAQPAPSDPASAPAADPGKTWKSQSGAITVKTASEGEFPIASSRTPAVPTDLPKSSVSTANPSVSTLATASAMKSVPYYRGRGVEGVAGASDYYGNAPRGAMKGDLPSGTAAGAPGRLAALEREVARLDKRTDLSTIESSERDDLHREIESVRRHLERIQQGQDHESNTEAYDSITDNPFLKAGENPLSTFSVDVDTASYANVRRFLNTNVRPPKGAVRIEELVNYFRYDYPPPTGNDPVACALEVATCPWQPEHRLVRVGLKAREISRRQRPAANLVFLVDVSGSMQPGNKLPLVKECLRLLTDQLGTDDRVSLVVYAGSSGCVLEPTNDREKIRAALDQLESGGSTNGAGGIQLAYDLVQRMYKKGGANRVILCTDGDFNVGISDQSQLVSLIQDKAKTGVFLSVLGFGFGNLKDSTLEKLADKGNGTYSYVDTIAEGRRIFVEQMVGTLVTLAKDVKVQVEFNPAQVGSYRLIGYENRLLAKEDFNDDTKDAGEVGAGHAVTALYEVVPVGKVAPDAASVDELKYRSAADEPKAAASREMLTVKVRYKQPEGDTSAKLEFPLTDTGTRWEQSSRDFRWAAAVAGFGLMLRESPHKGSLSWNLVQELAVEGAGEGKTERTEFVQMIDRAAALTR